MFDLGPRFTSSEKNTDRSDGSPREFTDMHQTGGQYTWGYPRHKRLGSCYSEVTTWKLAHAGTRKSRSTDHALSEASTETVNSRPPMRIIQFCPCMVVSPRRYVYSSVAPPSGRCMSCTASRLYAVSDAASCQAPVSSTSFTGSPASRPSSYTAMVLRLWGSRKQTRSPMRDCPHPIG